MLNVAGRIAVPPAGVWLKSVAWLLGLWVLHVVAFLSSYQSLVGLWFGSENYAHAVLVPPISLWLVWRQRTVLARLTPEPAPAFLLVMLALGFVWLLGHLGAVNTVVHFCLVGMVVALTTTLLGTSVARVLAFPLGFLFFAVPFGEFLFPIMMNATADFTVAALQLSGVPVYREGLQFVIPTGNWSVIEACSGLRYLIASMMVGTLFAYLNYRGLRRRLLFVVAAFVVPVVANWVRAYMIAMIGHLSNNRFAVDVDHLIYGWVFFGIVMFAMFMVGSRFADLGPDDVLVKLPAQTTTPAATGPTRRLAVAGLSALALVLPALMAARLDDPRYTQPPVLQAGLVTSTWHAVDAVEPSWQPELTPPAAVSSEFFGNEAGARVGVYLGYYRNQDEKRKLISSQNYLVKSTNIDWAIARTAVQAQETQQGRVMFDEVELRALRGSASRLIVWQTYWVNGHWTSSPIRAKAYALLQRLQGLGDDGATLIVYSYTSKPGEAQANLSSFVRDNLPQIQRRLRQAQGDFQP